jgi:hypothetical protein
MDLNNIPKNKVSGFPTGVSEHVYDTEGEMKAFIDGVNLADDIDVDSGEPFERDGKFVVRVKVGEWDEDDYDDEDEEMMGT